MRHFSGHRVDDMHVVVLQSLGREGRAYRQLVEEKRIIRLGTKAPFGCNVQLNFYLISVVLCNNRHLMWILIIPHWMLIRLNI